MYYYNFDLYANKHKLDDIEFLSHTLSGHYSHDIGNFRLKAGIQFKYFDYHSDLFMQDGQPDSPSSEHYLNYFADFTLDTYDKRYYPTHGSQIRIQGMLYTDDGLQYDDNSPFGSVAFRAETTIRLSSRFYLMPTLKGRFLFGSHIPAIYQNYIGGQFESIHLSWQQPWETTQHLHLVEQNFMGTKLALRYQLKDKFYITTLGEYGKESHKTKKIFDGDDLWGYALRVSYDSILGPIGLQANYSNLRENGGIYINAGFFF